MGGKSVLLHQAVHKLTTGGTQNLFQILLQEACMNVAHASLYSIRFLQSLCTVKHIVCIVCVTAFHHSTLFCVRDVLCCVLPSCVL